jgi:phage host-nuclease inhibitor protein Gam
MNFKEMADAEFEYGCAVGSPDFIPEPTKDQFHIETEADADWYLSKLASLNAEEGLLRAQSEAKIKRVVNERQGLEHRFQASLEHWAKSQITGKVKSLILDHGTVGFRKVPAGLKVVDKEAALTYCIGEDFQEIIKTTRAVDVANFKIHAEMMRKDFGILVPGIEQVEEHEAFSVRFPKDKE